MYEKEKRVLNMQVSSICAGENGKYAYVSFCENEKRAEGKIPECRILTNEGFTEEEISALEEYMRFNLAALKKTAAEIHPIDAFIK